MKRPLFWMGMVFLSTAAAFCHVPALYALAVGLGTAALALWLGTLEGAARRRMLLPLACCVAAAALWCQLWQVGYRAWLSPVVAQPTDGLLTVTAVGRRGRAWAYTGRATLVANGVERTLSLTATTFAPIDCAPGDLLRISGELQPLPEGFAALSQRDPLLYLRRAAPAGEERPHPLTRALAELRRSLSDSAGRLASGEGSGLLAALLSGDRSRLSPRLSESLRQAGLSHLVVVSGLHLSTLAMLLSSLLQGLSRPRLQSGLVIAFAWGFSLFSGLGPSVVRAAVMLTLLQLGPLLGRRSDGLTSLTCAGLLLVLLDPRTAGSVSFGLSFLATGGILLLSTPLANWALARLPSRLAQLPLATGLIQSLAITTAAQLGAAPLLLGVFGQMSLWGLPANLPAAPLVMLLLPLGWLSVLLCALLPALTPVLGFICGGLTGLLAAVAHFFGSLPFGQIGLTERYQLWWLAACYLAVGYLLARRPSAHAVGRVLLALMAALLVAVNLSVALSRSTAEFILVGDEGTLAVCRGDRAALFGAPRSADEADALLDAFERLGVGSLDFILLLDPGDARQPVAALAQAMDCTALLAPDTPSVRGFCRAAGLTLYAMPEEAFSPLGIPARRTEDGIEFLLQHGSVLKTKATCAIIASRAIPLPAPGRDMLRYRLTMGEDAA